MHMLPSSLTLTTTTFTKVISALPSMNWHTSIKLLYAGCIPTNWNWQLAEKKLHSGNQTIIYFPVPRNFLNRTWFVLMSHSKKEASCSYGILSSSQKSCWIELTLLNARKLYALSDQPSFKQCMVICPEHFIVSPSTMNKLIRLCSIYTGNTLFHSSIIVPLLLACDFTEIATLGRIYRRKRKCKL